MNVNTDLPLSEPIVHGYQYFTMPLAILGTVPESRDWILSNFIHVVHEKESAAQQPYLPYEFYFHDYATSPWLETVKVYRDWIAAVGLDPVDFCRDAIRSGYYVYLYIDQYYVPMRQHPGIEHYSHDIFVYGASDDSRMFSVYGYDSQGILQRSHIGYDEFNIAYESASILEAEHSGSSDFYFYRPKPDSSYEFNFRLVRQSFEDYLEGTNVSVQFDMYRPAPDLLYGMDVYPALKKYHTAYLAGDAGYDIRRLQLLWAHKRLMTCRLQRMAELAGDAFAPLVEDCREMEELAFSLRNGLLFRELAGETSEFDYPDIEKIDRIRTLEQRVMESAVKEIRASGR